MIIDLFLIKIMKKIIKLIVILFIILNLNITNINALTDLEHPKLVEIQNKIYDLWYWFNSIILNIELDTSYKLLKDIDLIIKDIKSKKLNFKDVKPEIITKIKELKKSITNIKNISNILKKEKALSLEEVLNKKDKELDSKKEDKKPENTLVRTGNLEVKNLDTINSKILTSGDTQEIANYRFKANIDDIIVKELNFKLLDESWNNINEIISEIKNFELVYNNKVISSRIALNSNLKFIIPDSNLIIPAWENSIITVRANIWNISNSSSVTKSFKLALISTKIISKSTWQILNDWFIKWINSYNSEVLWEGPIYSEDMLITNYKPLIQVNNLSNNSLTNSTDTLIFSFNVNSSDDFNSIFLKKFNLNISWTDINKLVNISSVEKNDSKLNFSFINNNSSTYEIEFSNLEEISWNTNFKIYADISGFNSDDELSIFIESLDNTFKYWIYDNVKSGSFIWSNNKTIFYNSFGLNWIWRDFKIKLD